MKMEDSGLSIDFIENADLTFSKVNNMGVTGHFTPLPKWLSVKKAIVDIQSKGNDCFMYAVTRALYPEKSNNIRVTPYLREKATELSWEAVTFPVGIDGESITNFERNNKIGIAIYACSEGDGPVIYRHRTPSEKLGKIVNLFAMKLPEGDSFDYHFCVVKRLSALLRNSEGKTKKVVCCSYCPARFYNKIGMVRKGTGSPRKGVIKNASEPCIEHEKLCKEVTSQKYIPEERMPLPGANILEFKKWDHLFPSPMFGVADFESALVDCHEKKGEKTVCLQRHVVVAFSVKFVSNAPALQFERVDYRGKNAGKKFVLELAKVAGKVWDVLGYDGIHAKRTREECARHDNETHCYACNCEFVPGDPKKKKVFDHDH